MGWLLKKPQHVLSACGSPGDLVKMQLQVRPRRLIPAHGRRQLGSDPLSDLGREARADLVCSENGVGPTGRGAVLQGRRPEIYR